MSDINVEKDVHTSGADVHDYGANQNNHTTTTNNARNSRHSDPQDRYYNPLAHVHSSNEARLPAFGGEFQPGLYKAIVDRKIANPAPLGLCAFALTTFVLSAINLQARGVTIPNIVVPLAFGYGGVVQLLAGMWEMAVGNTFGATALSSYGGFWISYALLFTPSLAVTDAYTGTDQTDSAVGFFLTGWFIFTTILLLCTLRSTIMFFSLFFTLDLAFLFLACADYATTDGAPVAALGLQKAGGVFGMLAAFLAWYNAFAGLADSSNSFFLVPVFHFPWSEKGRETRLAKAQSHTV
ncbi:Acetate permease A [Cytospora mali]|uniref:Acetate permease A n=1 Tax=Cytospora mali TaxID=578113 RepID=A0A194UVT3_CYTMA|nr:Acetate permease A [Valsa mali var. pyri (nom. inval.)]